MSEKYCKWTHDKLDDSNTWETDCGHSFWLEYDTPEDNGMNFCCYCGKKLIQQYKETKL